MTSNQIHNSNANANISLRNEERIDNFLNHINLLRSNPNTSTDQDDSDDEIDWTDHDFRDWFIEIMTNITVINAFFAVFMLHFLIGLSIFYLIGILLFFDLVHVVFLCVRMRKELK